MGILIESLLNDIKDIETLVAESSQATLKTILAESMDKYLKEAFEDESDDENKEEKEVDKDIEAGEGAEGEKTETPAIETEPTEDLDNIISGGSEEEAGTEFPSLETGSEEAPEEESYIDLTDKSYSEFLEVFQKMKDSDSVAFEDNQVTITDPESGNEYLIKEPKTDMDKSVEAPVEEGKSLMDEGMGEDTLVISTNVPYTEDENGVNPNSASAPTEPAIEETIQHTVQNAHRNQFKPDNFPVELTEAKAKLKEIETKYNTLKESYNALEKGAEKITEDCKGIVLNYQKLGFATKLMIENATSKSEKTNIVEKISAGKTLEEVKTISENLNKELKKKVIKETVTTDIKNKTVIAESKHSKDLLISEEVKKFIERNNEIAGYKYSKK